MVWLRIDRPFPLLLLILLFLVRCIGVPQLFAQSDQVARDVCVVIGAQGEVEYGEAFRAWAKRWQDAFQSNSTSQSTSFTLIDGSSKQDSDVTDTNEDREKLIKWIGEPTVSEGLQRASERWLVLIGHGTYEPSKETSGARFNLRGGDVSPEMLVTAIQNSTAESLSPTRWIIVNCSSCSGPFLKALSAPNRIIITATKTGSEQNFSRFGDYFSKAIANPEADLDHDKCVSLLEAFLIAGKNTEKFYKDGGRLASEQALLDDNGDKRGTPATFFQGIRPLKAPSDNLELDGIQAKRIVLAAFDEADALSESQRIEVELIENKIETLRNRKMELSTDDYYRELELLFREIARARSM